VGMDVSQTYSATKNVDPYAFYARMRPEGVVWDQGVEAWLVVSDGAIREVMRQDKKLVRQPVADIPDETLHAVSGGKRSRGLLHGADHARHHRWFVLHFSHRIVDEWRTSLLRPIANRLLDPVVGSGRLDVHWDYGNKFSIRVMAAVLGLPWQDDNWVDHCKELLDSKLEYLDLYFVGPSPKVERRALEAVREMNELLLPFIMAAQRRTPTEGDLLAELWRDGPSIMPGWGIEDMQAWVSTTFFAGTDTTTHAIQNAAYVLAEDQSRQDAVRVGGRPMVDRLAEEVLRMFPAAHFTRRMANVDFELSGAQIKKNDRVLMLDASANRDEARYVCPNDINLERENWRDHLAFSMGPRACSGAALARAEIQESISVLLDRLPNLRLDQDAATPKLEGFLFRSFQPVCLSFDPQNADQPPHEAGT
jgi:cytochrome P450